MIKFLKKFSKLIVVMTSAIVGVGSSFRSLYAFSKTEAVINSIVMNFTYISQTKVFESVLYKMELAK
ncbi:hypothetical protein H4J51_16280 [Colwellia sp. MB02u-18]|uniref:hypothetical protein n=1 Tax=unclassified Colwellia TaxID=196834 RepID=UPI0015F4F41D|nr:MULTISPECIES: hypothetical protein [unclassified Colwellia]MBA6224598.1 hypothetical protein [Colwellia sp. MB3u-45]MBA6268090.1 hypothetical protein [Colwellia sp. MB3u-43]MBA6322542.1 hypothetical protein [Colwellia sp. MB02u-19]MBA6326120.1 hypothetical protein [Colwellia sp. MB02u-18]MBA6331579.1 hypothetical protein [Colwellia sp. MB02u-12]